MKVMRKFIIFSLLALVMCSCGEYQRALKSEDYNYKFEFAKQAFENKRYVQAGTLFKQCCNVFKGTDKAEESLYLLGLSDYENQDYLSSGAVFKTYYQRYPKGKFV